MVPFARVGWFKNYEFKSPNLLKIKDSIFASNIKPHCHCEISGTTNGMIQHIKPVFSWRKNERRWQKAMSAWMAMGFDKLRKDTTYIKLILVTWCVAVSQFCIALQVQVHSQMQRDKPATHFHDEFWRIHWILRTSLSKTQESIHELNMKKRVFGNHICLKVKTPNINLSLLSIYIGLLYQKLCSPFFLLEN